MFALLGACGLIGVGAPVAAQTAPAFPDFEYEAPPECPDRAGFGAQIALKLGATLVPTESINAHIASVAIAAEGGFKVNIRFQPGQGTNRTLVANDCTDAVVGAALIVALAIDPTRSPVTDSSPSSGKVPPAPEAAASAEPSTGAESALAPKESGTPPEVALPEPPIPVRSPLVTGGENQQPDKIQEPAHTESAVFRSARLGVAFGTNNWLGPQLARQFQLFVEAEPVVGRWCLRATAYRGDTSAEVDDLRATFGVWGGRLDVAPYVLGKHEMSWRLALAGFFDAASLNAAGDASSAVAVGQSADFLWLAAGALGRLQTPEWYRLRLEIQGELVVPLRRPEFRFDAPLQPIHTPPRLAVGAHLGLAIRLF